MTNGEVIIFALALLAFSISEGVILLMFCK